MALDRRTRSYRQWIWRKGRLRSPVPNPTLCWEIPDIRKGIILGVRQHLHIWRVLELF